MADLGDPLLVEVLKACEPSAPLYPAPFAATSGLDRGLLDQALDELRLRGLVRFSDWVQGKGQGYVMTPQGAQVMRNPRLLKQARPEEEEPDNPFYERREGPWARGEAVREALLHPVRPRICIALLVLNVAVFVLGLVLAARAGVVGDYLSGGGGPRAGLIYDELGALVPAEVLVRDQWWRLLGYAFVHGGLLHIGMNMYFLFSLGPLLETMWGSVRFLVVYMVGAIVGGCVIMLTGRSAVGASGALCGLLTSMGMWVYLNRGYLPPNVVSTWMRAIVTNIVLIGIMSVSIRNVSWEGHLGGAIGGALVSVPLNFHRFGRGWQRLLGGLGALLVPVLAVGVVVENRGRLLEDLLVRAGQPRPQIDIQKRAAGIAEAVQARAELFAPYKEAEAKALAVYVDQGASLLRDLKEETDKQRLADARQAFDEAGSGLRAALADFDKVGPFVDEQVSREVGYARAYLHAWLSFYEAFSKAIAAPPPAPAGDVELVTQKLNAIAKARRPLERATLFPAEPAGPKLRKSRDGA